MRAVTGRDLVIKVEGCYHGHHDSVEVSVLPDADGVGPAERPIGVAGNTGIPPAIRDLDRRRRLQRPRRGRARARGAPGQGRRHDRRAGDDERRHHPARPGLSRGPARPAARARRAARLRRGQDRPDRLARRRHGDLRRHPRHRLPGQGARRRPPGRPRSAASPR